MSVCSLAIAVLAHPEPARTRPEERRGAFAVGQIQRQVAASVRPVELTEVSARLKLLHGELELIRFEMGAPENEQPEIGVTNAALREVYFQALTLLRKTDRLYFEQTRQRLPLPEALSAEVQPSDVLDLVDRALQGVQRVRSRIGIPTGEVAEARADLAPGRAERAPAPGGPAAAAAGPTAATDDVFRSIVQANRQLNLLLEQRFAPSEVVAQVTVAIGYASRLLGRFPVSATIPPEPPLEHGKRPVDVYQRLVGCFEKTQRIAHRSGLQVLDLSIKGEHLEYVTPSDVYDIASLLVSELAYLHLQLEDTGPPLEPYDPGRKFPAHAYQRAGLLEAQLRELERWVDQNPEWLKERTATD